MEKAMTKLLIENGAEVNIKNTDGETPIHEAYNMEIAELLINNGADVNVKDKYGRTPLHKAKSMDVICLLVKHHADVNAFDNDGLSPICYWRNQKHIRYLLKHGADINIIDTNKRGVLRISNELIWNKFFIKNGAVASSILIYRHCRELFTKKQQEVFDAFVSITSNDDYFFQMCLAYQNDQKNNVKIEIKDLDIL
jgi:ankyrin repeat protein